MKWILDVKEGEDGALYIELPQDLLDSQEWKEGDTLVWIDNKDGSFTMKKKETEFVLVECVSTFRQRYMVEVPSGKAEWALDAVTSEDAVEFSQLHLGETIVSHRVMTREEALKLCGEDNAYASKWSDEKKVEAFFTPPEVD